MSLTRASDLWVANCSKTNTQALFVPIGSGNGISFLVRFVSITIGGDVVPEPKKEGVRQKRTIQDLRLAEGVLAVKESVNCVDLDELRTRVIARFEQNSQETRLR